MGSLLSPTYFQFFLDKVHIKDDFLQRLMAARLSVFLTTDMASLLCMGWCKQPLELLNCSFYLPESFEDMSLHFIFINLVLFAGALIILTVCSL